MKKLNLNLEDLRVESFDTLPAPQGEKGTVQGYGTPPLVSCGETACDDTCFGTCEQSCNGTCEGDTCEGTCYNSCGGTCSASCGGTCNTCGSLSCVPTCFNWPGCETTTLP